MNQLDPRIFQIAMTMLPGVGDINAKSLIAHCGGAEAVFKQKKSALEKVPGIGAGRASSILSSKILHRAEKELAFVEKNGIQLLYFLDDQFPKRLEHCLDSPIVLYYKGKGDLNPARAMAIVGTRKATAHGKANTEKFVADLKKYDCTVISGLAYGIDITAHKACVDYEIPTIDVLAHGLDRVYPQLHIKIAGQMMAQGGLITEFPSGTKPDAPNFPKRNRIIAGLSDSTIVVEAAEKGGALITADLAAGYNRDVFAFPGRIDDPFSAGCNKLIYLNKAAILRSTKDLEFYLNWSEDQKSKSKSVQAVLFVDVAPQEEPIANVIREAGKAHIDVIASKAKMPMSQVVSLLFNLEMKGALRTHPGKVYEWLAQ